MSGAQSLPDSLSTLYLDGLNLLFDDTYIEVALQTLRPYVVEAALVGTATFALWKLLRWILFNPLRKLPGPPAQNFVIGDWFLTSYQMGELRRWSLQEILHRYLIQEDGSFMRSLLENVRFLPRRYPIKTPASCSPEPPTKRWPLQ